MGKYIKFIQLHACVLPDSLYFDENDEIIDFQEKAKHYKPLTKYNKGTLWECECGRRYEWSGTVWAEPNTTLYGTTVVY